MDYTHHCRSPLGGITLASDGEALTGLWFDGQKYYAAALSGEHEERMLPVFEQTEAWLIQATQGYRDVSTPGALHEDSSGRSAPHPTAQHPPGLARGRSERPAWAR